LSQTALDRERQAAALLQVDRAGKTHSVSVGQFPAPARVLLIEENVGDRVIVCLPNAMDGSEVTQAPISVGQTFTYDYTVSAAGLF
jgi:hypothetical protein